MDNVNPPHYDGTKCIEEMIDEYGERAAIDFCRCNVYKYKYRADRKNGEEDLKKAKWYEEYASKLLEEVETNEDYIIYLENRVKELIEHLSALRKYANDLERSGCTCISTR